MGAQEPAEFVRGRSGHWYRQDIVGGIVTVGSDFDEVVRNLRRMKEAGLKAGPVRRVAQTPEGLWQGGNCPRCTAALECRVVSTFLPKVIHANWYCLSCRACFTEWIELLEMPPIGKGPLCASCQQPTSWNYTRIRQEGWANVWKCDVCKQTTCALHERKDVSELVLSAITRRLGA